MQRITHWICCSLALLAATPRAEAQRPAWGAAALATVSDDRSAAGGQVGVLLRAYDRVRFLGALAAMADLSGGESPIGRAEALAQFHVTPYQRMGWGVYAVGGLGYEVQEQARGVARLVLALGAERAPAGPRSFYVEAGLGGGWRVVAGVRWRPRGRR